ncbi:MAG: 50S ribosomal protein L28 [bacterium]|jgi:large subunit ribosomal protein L28|nr:50S ribosomal protein L28 [Bacillota bacterium]HHW54203.1 50S ribosomal protein L28 [Bacillota bacterium]
MSKVCKICGKGKQTGYKVSHSNIKSKRSWSPNLQKIKIIMGKAPKRVYVCTRCLRSGKVQRAY